MHYIHSSKNDQVLLQSATMETRALLENFGRGYEFGQSIVRGYPDLPSALTYDGNVLEALARSTGYSASLALNIFTLTLSSHQLPEIKIDPLE